MAVPKGTLNEARWSEILNAAADAFAEKGYEATTIEDIASRVGLLKGSLYYYIKSKEDLLCQVSILGLKRHLGALRNDRGVNHGDPTSRLAGFIKVYMTQLERDPPWSITTEHDLGGFTKSRSSPLPVLRREIHLLLKDIIVQGIEEGSFDPATDASIAANSILSMMNATRRWRQPTGPMSMQQIGAWYEQFILAGLTSHKQTRPHRRRSPLLKYQAKSTD